jgi:hypothetical protein
MIAQSRIQCWVQQNLADDHNVGVVGFIDQLLPVASEVGEIKCTLANDRALRFQVPGQPPWDVELGRAKSKLRMLCARLSVLCNESGDQEVSLYGGEGVIREGLVSPTNPNAVAIEQRVTVRFKNTPSVQEFTISKCCD